MIQNQIHIGWCNKYDGNRKFTDPNTNLAYFCLTSKNFAYFIIMGSTKQNATDRNISYKEIPLYIVIKYE